MPNAQAQFSQAVSRTVDVSEGQFALIYLVSYPLFLVAEIGARAWRWGAQPAGEPLRVQRSVFAEASAAARSTIATALAD